MIFRRLVSYVGPHRKAFFLAFAMLFLATSMDILSPLLIASYIDHYLLPKHWVLHEIWFFFALYIALQASSAYLHFRQEISFQRIALAIIRRLRHDLFVKVQHLALSYFDRTPTGSMITRMTNDTETIKDLYVSVLASLLQNAVMIIGVIIGLFILDPLWALLAVGIFPVFLLLIVLYHRLSRPVFWRMRNKLSQLNTHLNESLQGMSIIQIFLQEVRFYQQFQKLNEEHYKARMKSIKWDALLLRPATDLLWALAIFILIQVFGWQAISLHIKIGALYGFINLVDRVFEPLQQIVLQWPRIQESTVSAERMFQLLDEQELAPQQQGNDQLRIEQGAVEFDKVSFAYNDGEPVLENISFRIEPGQTIGLVGQTGSGKSTIVQLLMRFYLPSEGEIRIDGHDLNAFSEQELRSQIGLVLQDAVLFHGDVKSNIGLNRENLSEEEIIRAAEFVQADPFIRQLPNQYNHQLTEGGSTLSSGEKQLIAFARTMALQPKILLLDEATAHIDSETEALIQTGLQRIRRDRTTLIVAHRLSTIRDADLILVLDRGRIVERGTHQQLMAQKGIYYEMDRLQHMRSDDPTNAHKGL